MSSEEKGIFETVKEKVSNVTESAKEAIFGKDGREEFRKHQRILHNANPGPGYAVVNEPDSILGMPLETVVASCGKPEEKFDFSKAKPVYGSAILEKTDIHAGDFDHQ